MLQIAKQYLTEKNNELFQEAKVGTVFHCIYLSNHNSHFKATEAVK